MSDPPSLEIRIDPERVLRGNWHLPEASAWPAPVVFFCHGFKGFKDWGPWPWFCDELAQSGFAVLRFNFSLAGVGEARDHHDEPEKFNRNTYGAEMQDLEVLWSRPQLWGAPAAALDRDRGLALVGHSRGGLVSLLHASEVDHVTSVVSLAAPGHSQRFGDEVLEKWRQDGTLEIVHARTGQVFQLERSVLEDFERNQERYDLPRALAARPVPTLVVHGSADETVPVEEAHFINDAIAHAHKDLLILPNVSHTFGAQHPFGGPDAVLREIRSATTAWLRKHHGGEERNSSLPKTQSPS